jgi:hypothetical protein
MKKIYLSGGVGNNIFQLSYAKKECCIAVDLTSVKWLSRLLGWTVHDKWLDMQDMCRAMGVDYRTPNLMDVLNLFILFLIGGKKYKYENNDYIYDYFQNVSHFDCTVIQELLDKSGLRKVKVNKLDAVLHYRGGDFVGTALDENFTKFITKFNNFKFNNKCVITNDMDSERINSVKYFVSSSEPVIDFCTILNAKISIFTNSSFAFWATVFGIAAGNIETVYIGKNNIFYDHMVELKKIYDFNMEVL